MRIFRRTSMEATPIEFLCKLAGGLIFFKFNKFPHLCHELHPRPPLCQVSTLSITPTGLERVKCVKIYAQQSMSNNLLAVNSGNLEKKSTVTRSDRLQN